MDIILTIIAVIVIFSVIVLIHEAGHFFAARRAGIKVLEFGIGFPPRLFKKKIGDTTYSVNAIPFGGFVKLHGEDSSSKEILADPKSYAHKSAWVRTKVVLAGVFMNFVLAIFLLTVGFIFGIEPLLVSENDLFNYLSKGVVQSSSGYFIGSVSPELIKQGVEPGDQLLTIDDKAVTDPLQTKIFEKKAALKDVDITLQKKGGQLKKVHLPLITDEKDLGLRLKPYTQFPRLIILQVKEESASGRAGLTTGDTILQMNGKEIYYPTDYTNALIESEGIVMYKLLKGQRVVDVRVPLQDQKRVVIADIFADSAAAKQGFKKGDVIVAIDGVVLTRLTQVQEILKAAPGKQMSYKVYRNGQEIDLTAQTGENNLLGVALSFVNSYVNNDLSYYRGSVITSITQIQKVRYGPWTSFKNALSESARLTGLTIKAFGNTIASIFSSASVPADIGGPVQIAFYTHTFIQEGFFALLRFTALLSLSLAVINVLPIPALDGGRLLFIVVEVVTGRRVNARIESMVHGIGFLLLLLLIGLVTYSDVVKLF